MNQIIFQCRKCYGYLVVNTDKPLEDLQDVCEKDCPYCGEEPYQNWILSEVILEGDEDSG